MTQLTLKALITVCASFAVATIGVTISLLQLHADTPHSGAAHRDEVVPRLERIEDKVDEIYEKLLTRP